MLYGLTRPNKGGIVTPAVNASKERVMGGNERKACRSSAMIGLVLNGMLKLAAVVAFDGQLVVVEQG